MARYKLTRQAERDYREILAFTLNEWGVGQFDTYANVLDQSIERLVDMPRLGVSCDNIRLGYYRYRVGKHYIFYRINAEILEIARILHIKRRLSRDLFDDLDEYP
jgi:toxin ParE1/3/4